MARYPELFPSPNAKTPTAVPLDNLGITILAVKCGIFTRLNITVDSIVQCQDILIQVHVMESKTKIL